MSVSRFGGFGFKFTGALRRGGERESVLGLREVDRDLVGLRPRRVFCGCLPRGVGETVLEGERFLAPLRGGDLDRDADEL